MFIFYCGSAKINCPCSVNENSNSNTCLGNGTCSAYSCGKQMIIENDGTVLSNYFCSDDEVKAEYFDRIVKYGRNLERVMISWYCSFENNCILNLQNKDEEFPCFNDPLNFGAQKFVATECSCTEEGMKLMKQNPSLCVNNRCFLSSVVKEKNASSSNKGFCFSKFVHGRSYLGCTSDEQYPDGFVESKQFRNNETNWFLGFCSDKNYCNENLSKRSTVCDWPRRNEEKTNGASNFFKSFNCTKTFALFIFVFYCWVFH